MFWCRRPQISVVVVVYRMRREAPRTLYSLSPAYQRGVSGREYEVIVVENPSEEMLTPDQVRSFGRRFRYVVNPRPSCSPASALNLGAEEARGRTLLLMIDGARILSPGILQQTLTATRLYDRPVVATLAWHLGPDNQARSVHQGYCQEVEDRLLADSGWESDGYRLFGISSLAGSCARGWFLPIRESNCLALSRDHFRALGGYCEEFTSPGGGFVNLDFYARAVSNPSRTLVILLGEGSFHQFHGGAATNRLEERPIRQFQEEYTRLRGQPFVPPQTHPIFLGSVPETARLFLRLSVRNAEERWRQQAPPRPEADSARHAWAAGSAPAPAADSSQVLTVLGMHRSGTSCLAGTLMECGVDFGEVSRRNNFNLKGNNENQQIMDLQDRLLADNGGSWKDPPAEVRWGAAHRQARDAIIDQFRLKNSPRWGFKDPRTLLTLEGWLEALPDMRMVGIFRHPDAVALSLAHRNQFTRQQGHALWCRYNRRLLAFHRQQPFPILYFSERAEEFFRQLEALVDLLGLVPPSAGLQFFEAALLHFEPPQESKLPPEVAELYRQLHAVAFYRPEVQQGFYERRRAA